MHFMLKTNFIVLILYLFCTKITSAPQQTLLLDNFEKYPFNLIGGITDASSESGSSNRALIQLIKGKEAFGGSGNTLEFSYNVIARSMFVFYFSLLDSLDLSNYEYLSFWIKGSRGREFFQVKLSNYSESSAISVWEYSEILTKEWQKVVIPLDAFWNLQSRSAMKELVFEMVHEQCSQNYAQKRGTIYIDDILFGSHNPGSLTIDRFNDNLTTNATGGNIGIFCKDQRDSSRYSFNFVNSPNESGNKLQINYDNRSYNSEEGGVFFMLGGGENRGTFTRNIIESYDMLYFETNSQADNDTNPGSFYVQMKADTNDIREVFISDIDSTFKAVKIDFSDFKLQSQTDSIGEITFLFRRNKQDRQSGIVFLDNIELRSSDFDTLNDKLAPIPTQVTMNGIMDSTAFVLQDSLTISAFFDQGIERLESVRLEGRNPSTGTWRTLNRQYAKGKNEFSWTFYTYPTTEKDTTVYRLIEALPIVWTVWGTF